MSPEEYLYGGPRVARWFAEQGLQAPALGRACARWQSPEAEWGFDETLRADVEGFARDHGHRVDRVLLP